MPEGLDKLASGVGKAIKTVPDLYECRTRDALFGSDSRRKSGTDQGR